MKRKMSLCLTMVLIVGLFGGITAQASPGGFSFTFRNVTATSDSQVMGYRTKDKGKDWTITISSGTLSSTNIFGARPRKGLSDDSGSLGPYQKYKSKVTNLKRTFSQNVSPGANRPVLLRGKKDDSSTSTAALEVTGSFQP